MITTTAITLKSPKTPIRIPRQAFRYIADITAIKPGDPRSKIYAKGILRGIAQGVLIGGTFTAASKAIKAIRSKTKKNPES